MPHEVSSGNSGFSQQTCELAAEEVSHPAEEEDLKEEGGRGPGRKEGSHSAPEGESGRVASVGNFLPVLATKNQPPPDHGSHSAKGASYTRRLPAATTSCLQEGPTQTLCARQSDFLVLLPSMT